MSKILQDTIYMSTTNCVGTTTGAIYVSGGMGVAKDEIIGGNIMINGDIINNNKIVISSKWNYIEQIDNLIWFGSSGNYHVGINTSTPSFNLDVNGTIRASSITTGILHVDTGSTITNINATSITLGTLISDIIDANVINVTNMSVSNLMMIPNGINSGYLFNRNVTINPSYSVLVSNLGTFGLYILNFAFWGTNTPSGIFSSWYLTYGDGYINITSINSSAAITLSNSVGNLTFKLNGLVGSPWFDYGKYSCAYTKLVIF